MSGTGSPEGWTWPWKRRRTEPAAEVSVTDLLEGLRERLHDATGERELLTWAARGPTEVGLLRTLLLAADPRTPVLLDHLSTHFQRDGVQSSQAVVDWCTRDPAAAGVIRLALEATAIPNPDAPAIVVRRVAEEVLELGAVFDVAIMVSVSPNGRYLSLRAVKNPDAAAPPARIRVAGLGHRSNWHGRPYDILLRYDSALRTYIGILSPWSVPSAEATPALLGPSDEGVAEAADAQDSSAADLPGLAAAAPSLAVAAADESHGAPEAAS